MLLVAIEGNDELGSFLYIYVLCHQPYFQKYVFILIPKKGNAKECSNLTIALISLASKVMPKILQASLQQKVN